MTLIEPEEIYHWCGAESYEVADRYNIETLEGSPIYDPRCPVVEEEQDYE